MMQLVRESEKDPLGENRDVEESEGMEVEEMVPLESFRSMTSGVDL